MQLCASCALLLGILFLTVFDSSDGLQTTVRPNKGSTVTVSTDLPLDQCAVCTVSGVNNTQTSCHSTLSLVADEEVTLLFNCTKSIDQAFTVKITQAIECIKDKCSPTTGETQPSILSEFTRTFIWDLKAPEKTVMSLHILGEGLVETSKPESCSDGFQYSVTSSELNGIVQTQAYCRGGSVTHLDLANEAVSVSLKVNPKAQAVPVLFQASAAPLKDRIMVISAAPYRAVNISRNPVGAECNVCLVGGSNPTCSDANMILNNKSTITLGFNCHKPEDVFIVAMDKIIECTQSSCTPATGEVDPNFFKGFKRSMTWYVNVPEWTEINLDFPGDGLKEIFGSDKCEDGYQYSVQPFINKEVETKKYCKSGLVSYLDLPRFSSFTAEVPKGGELDSTVFTVKASPRSNRMMFVTPDPDTKVYITRETTKLDCSVCMVKESKRLCNSKSIMLEEALNTSVEFTCPHPQNYFNVEINTEIDCTETSCAGGIGQTKTSLFPDFNRTFTWDLKAPSNRAFQLDFPESGMRQIPNGDSCPDENTYSVLSYLRSGPATVCTFCRGGNITTIQVRYKGRMLLQVPGNRKTGPLGVKLSAGPETNMVATVKVSLPRGVSDTDFMSAKYPNDFPDNQQMQWDFIVPGMHNYTVQFREYTAPECLKKDVVVEYQKKKSTKLTPADPQPAHQQGNFNMLLWNCETNRTLQGLNLKFRVSVMRSGHPVLCAVDLTKQEGVSLQIEQVGSDPFCEMSINSEVKKKINVAAGTKASLSFLDCPNEDVHLTASKIIGCQNLNSCSVSDTPLTVPKLDSCLPIPLHSFTWYLNIPEDGTVDLMSPTGSLRQSLPGQECNDSHSLHVADGGGSPVGDFCFDGIIEKVQIHSNASVTATVQDFTKNRGPFLNVSFHGEISESIIYRINPMMSSVALLATPNWPLGMKPSSTASWIVSLPSQYKAALQFVNVSQPKCDRRHTSIKVHTMGSKEEMLSRREDEEVEDEVVVPESFYLNMSNCLPQEGHFGAVTKIVLQKKTNILAIILGVIGGLLLLIGLVVAVVLIKKKKKEKMNKESFIYISKGNIFQPGDAYFSKTRSDNESHVYASIDETMVYGHLLNDTYADSIQDRYKGMQVDSYQTFTGPTDGQLPVIQEPEEDQYKPFLDPSESFMPPRPHTPISREDSLGFQDRRMVDNELYTFKSTGEINTIRLSGADLEPEPAGNTLREESF
ncbi:hypothetical protein LDENG_00190760 [Lucifuga dentata]|nr:hypothetical protein LDENG_00190760 [Lucifuga dentata]